MLNDDEQIRRMARKLLPPDMYQDFLKVMEDEEGNQPICKRLYVKTDTEDEDREFVESQNFTVKATNRELVVKTYLDKERTQIASKTIINFDFIISIQYVY